ncbi:hypothetical protein B5F07_17890 [Lachnoclostridium sp. An169]|uniref:glycosyl hydrolase n=1 Tax=Lachnoclostridium sp. An169 TaxID=1965569 RepID=UPI000B37ACDF|nr:glycosyl hydrolase [Lachnoclostridium sp. An169]OUP81325.1 hypothetical protein B5F07_17890 [Lachnoclostridium sp. An169]
MTEKISMDVRPKVRYWLPGAAMEEADLREEIRMLARRGFGGIEVVVLQSVPQEILLSEDGWGSKNWDRMVAVINDEAKKQGMTVDLAAGPGWPIASPVLESADDPGVLCELTYGCLELEGGTHYDGALPERRVVHEEGTPKRIAVMAYRIDTSDPEKNAKLGTKVKSAFGEREYRLPLIAESYINLENYVNAENNKVTARDSGHLVWNVPGTPEDRWMVFAFWYQPAVQKINGGRTYVVDHLSREGAKAVADYWEPVLSAGHYDAVESLFCDSLEYDVATDWTPALPEIFRKINHYDLLPYLPFIGMCDTYPAGDAPAFPSRPESIQTQVNDDYMEILTRLYCEEHLEQLEEMAGKYGKTVRYQVAYNKPFEEERCGLYVEIPENEALGRSQIDGQRLMAAAVHMGRKSRYSFECAAEFGQSYGQGYEDLMWWVKRSLMAGMNAQVLHGASYSGRCTGADPNNVLAKSALWPGYEGFGKYVSNNWNRTPDENHARGCMDAISRMNRVFREHARIDLCIFRQAYENSGLGADYYLYDDDGLLTNMGYSYEYVSDYLLHLPQAEVRNGELDPEGPGYRALIVPHQGKMSGRAMQRILALAEEGLPVVLVGEAPEESCYFSEWRSAEERENWRNCRERLWGRQVENIVRAAEISDVPEALAACGVSPRVFLENGGDLMTAVRKEENTDRIWYVLYGYNRIHTGEGFVGPGNADPKDVKPVYQRPGKASERVADVALSGNGPVFSLDPWSGSLLPEKFMYDGAGRMKGRIRVEEDEMIILCLHNDDRFSEISGDLPELSECRKAGRIRFEEFSFCEFGPDTPEGKSFLRSSFAETPTWSRKLETDAELIPWHEMDPSLKFAAGAGIYRGTLEIDEEPADGERLIVSLGDVYDTFTVCVNGVETSFPDQVMKRADITGLARKGKNRIEVRVVSELYNKLVGTATGGDIPYNLPGAFSPRCYGICPSEEKPVEVYIKK